MRFQVRQRLCPKREVALCHSLRRPRRSTVGDGLSVKDIPTHIGDEKSMEIVIQLLKLVIIKIHFPFMKASAPLKLLHDQTKEIDYVPPRPERIKRRRVISQGITKRDLP